MERYICYKLILRKINFCKHYKDNNNMLIVIIDFVSSEALKSSSDDEFSKIRYDSGSILKIGLLNIMSENSFIKSKH